MIAFGMAAVVTVVIFFFFMRGLRVAERSEAVLSIGDRVWMFSEGWGTVESFSYQDEEKEGEIVKPEYIVRWDNGLETQYIREELTAFEDILI